MAKKVFSIVIPNRNTKDLLRNCITSIYRTQTGKLDLQVVVVDNGSKDGSTKVIETEFPKVKLIKNKVNQGFAKAVNKGWRSSVGDLILFLNSDTVVESATDFNVIRVFMDENPDVGSLSLKLMLRSGRMDLDTHRGFPTPWSSICYFLGLEKIFPKSKVFSKYHQGWKDVNTIHEIDAGCGASLIVRRKILKNLGGWDENYFFYGEDLDLCYRMKKAGWKIVYYPFVEITHFKGASSGLRAESLDIANPDEETLLKSTEGSINAWIRFYKKFYEDKYPNLITSIVIAGIRLKGLVRTLRQKYFR